MSNTLSLRKAAIKLAIQQAFSQVKYPGDWCLQGSNEGEEPALLTKEFQGKNNWQLLSPSFLDRAPDGYGTALCFFSDEAFRFYLPAYLIADLDGHLVQQDPIFHLTHGLDHQTRNEMINPQRYGERTWFDCRQFKFSMFSQAQVAAIVEYLKWYRDTDPGSVAIINQALDNYWNQRLLASHQES
jgi:hypothetical protein